MNYKSVPKTLFFLFISFILICCSHTKTFAATSIPSGAKQYNGHYYYVYTAKKTDGWTDCKQYCENVGGHLATITSKEEDEFVYSLIKNRSYNRAFFGLYNAGTKKSPNWKWVTGEKVSYTNWADGEPSYTDGTLTEAYGQFFNDLGSGWNDGVNYTSAYNYSSFTLLYICEWDSAPTSAETVTTTLTINPELAIPVIANVSQSSASNVVLDWEKVANASGYILFRSTDGTNYYLLSTISSGTTTSYTDKTIIAGKTYYYRIISTKDNTSSYNSISYKVDTSIFSSMKNPVLVSVKKKANKKTVVTLKWKKMSGISGYMIYRKTGNGKYKRIFSLANKSKVAINDVGLKSGTKYYYYVRAYKTVSTGNGKIKYIGPKSNIKTIKL